MQTTIPSDLINKFSSKPEAVDRHHGRKIKTSYSKLLEFLVRKTEADRRIELFGSDPFR